MNSFLNRCLSPKLLVSGLFLSLTVCQELPSQQRAGNVIGGIVVDALTGEPLENVNVFLSHTLIGTSTGNNGKFEFSKLPPGKYELVASKVGYERSVQNLQATLNDSLHFEIRLEQHVLQSREIEIVGHEPLDWKKNLKLFTRAFIGAGRHAGLCTILNPWVLEFQFEEKKDTLVVHSDSLLFVENRALGYRLYILLDEFVWNPDMNIGHYLYHFYFEEMKPISKEELSTWTNNRADAYEGSMKQFLKGLYWGVLNDEKFILTTGPKMELQAGGGHRVAVQDFESEEIDSLHLKRFAFPEYLRIESGKKEIAHTRAGWEEHHRDVSLLSPKETFILVDSTGNLFDPLSLNISGAWSESRISELLRSF